MDAAARAIAEQIGSVFAEASGIARGNPLIKAGAAVHVSLVANPFAGRYTLTHTRHVYETRNGYRTHFEISGRQERSLLGLASGGGGGGGDAAATPGLGGVQVGIVTDNADPQNLGRVRVRLPYAGVDFVSDWARVAAPGNGASRGFVWIPEVDDEVLRRLPPRERARAVRAGRPLERPGCAPADRARRRRAAGPRVRQPDGQTDRLLGQVGKRGDPHLLGRRQRSQVQVDAANKKVVVTADWDGKVEMKSGGDIDDRLPGHREDQRHARRGDQLAGAARR